MKFIVDRMPEKKAECPFIENKTVQGYCKLGHHNCNLDEKYPITCRSCRWLREQANN